MIRFPAKHLTAMAAAVLILLPARSVTAEASATQSFTLRPGWNAVFLEVQPEPRDPASVFAGLPVESVWTWMERHTTVLYIQNPSEPLWDKPGWKGYRPLEADDYLTTLYAILANRAYLVKITGSDPVLWTVTGRPSTEPFPWTADSFNLAGFQVNPAAPPSFESYFAPSPAHAGQAIYRLSDLGVWEFIDDPAGTTINRGEAYWVYCEGFSSYRGPLTVSLPGSGLDYGLGLTEMAITLLNVSGEDRTVTLRQGSPASPAALVYKLFDEGTLGFIWPPLPLSFDLRAGGKKTVTLAVRRELFTGSNFEGILEVADGGGSLILVPVSAKKAE